MNDDIRNIGNIMHNTCHIPIPKYRKEVKMKTTGMSIWNKNIASASKQVNTKHSIWKTAGALRQKDNTARSQWIAIKRVLGKVQGQTYASQMDLLAKKITTTGTRLFHRLI